MNASAPEIDVKAGPSLRFGMTDVVCGEGLLGRCEGFPQRLKPRVVAGFFGTAEGVP